MEIAELCLALLPDAMGLSDVFGFTDWELDRYVTLPSFSCVKIFQSTQSPGCLCNILSERVFVNDRIWRFNTTGEITIRRS